MSSEAARNMLPTPVARQLGLVEYDEARQKMVAFTESRSSRSADEFWLLQHPAIFTLGRHADDAHLLNPQNIPVVRVERGGQVTYHGPGQLVIYTLIDINRLGIGPRGLVTAIEQSIVELLTASGVAAEADPDAPGVYVHSDGQRAKIASLGLRIRSGRSFHGLSLNVDMDLSPYQLINPCGHAGLKMAQLKDFIQPASIDAIGLDLAQRIASKLSLPASAATSAALG